MCYHLIIWVPSKINWSVMSLLIYSILKSIIALKQVVFLNSLFILHFPSMGLWYVVNLFGMFIALIPQLCITRFHWSLCYPLTYTYSTSIAIFRLILLINITTEHTLHFTQRSKRFHKSITHNSIVIASSYCKGRLIC